MLVLWPGMEPEPFAVEVGSLNHWTTREVPDLPSLKKKKKKNWHVYVGGDY